MIAALFVEKNGAYYGLPDVDPWPLDRDARTYAGPHRVVAHPPCARWCRLAGLVEARWGHKRGDDGGCFASALASVRRFGGVLEHPAESAAWPAFGLPRPSRNGWARDFYDGWSTEVAQRNYGHKARKLTWLYAVGVVPPRLNWRRPAAPKHQVSNLTNHGGLLEWLPKWERAATPIAFRDVLLKIAKGAL